MSKNDRALKTATIKMAVIDAVVMTTKMTLTLALIWNALALFNCNNFSSHLERFGVVQL